MIYIFLGLACNVQNFMFSFSVTDVPSLGQSEMSLHFHQLLEEADEFDMIHDIVLKVHV